MKKEKKVIYIEADCGKDFEAKMNDTLKGKLNAQVQIFGKYEGCIIYDEIVTEEEEKTIADLFEEAGCGAKCSECPYFEKPTDGRKKWTICAKANRRVSGDSRACSSYYLERRKDVSEVRTEAEREEVEDRGLGRGTQDLLLESILQTERKDSVFAS